MNFFLFLLILHLLILVHKKMRLNLKGLEETKIYYEQELKDEELTGRERNSYLKALKLIEGFIERENLRVGEG